jgi:methylenetetrahydrofolate dehydrogenase (NADP+) / methenyltetrahydrofolate cyclohydrolase
MAQIIDGRKLSTEVIEDVAVESRAFYSEFGLEPALAVILVGDDPASQVYVRNKVKRATQAGIKSIEHRLTTDIDQQRLNALVSQLNNDPKIHGILVQLPLPDHVDETTIINTISPEKDVDGFHPINVGRVSAGQIALTPCTPLGCMIMLRKTLGDLKGKTAVVVGRSNIVGKPMATLLLQEDCTVTVVHSQTNEIEKVCASADILIAAIGRPEMINAAWVKPGAVVIDVGINAIEREGERRLVGDVDFTSVEPIVGAITPVPGGVGPMTIACLMKNTLNAARDQMALATE